jgi:hypothetical protein
MEQLSNTVLGKILAISIIIYYTNENPLYGLIFCLLTIIYYQTKYIEGMENENVHNMENTANTLTASDVKLFGIKNDTDITFHENQIQKNVPKNYSLKLNENIAKPNRPDSENDSTIQNVNNNKTQFENIIQHIQNILQLQSSINTDPKTTITTNLPKKIEPFETESSTFTNYNYPDVKITTKDDLKDVFKSHYCKNGILTYKNIGVKSEMTPLIFNEIEFNDETSPCNICSDHCLYKIDPKKISVNVDQINDKKLKTEKTLFWDMFTPRNI